MLYWIISTLFMIGQQYFILEEKEAKPKPSAGS
jgi:membrane protein insertase Oxa1/YidC/SpoIIIJ